MYHPALITICTKLFCDSPTRCFSLRGSNHTVELPRKHMRCINERRTVLGEFSSEDTCLKHRFNRKWSASRENFFFTSKPHNLVVFDVCGNCCCHIRYYQAVRDVRRHLTMQNFVLWAAHIWSRYIAPMEGLIERHAFAYERICYLTNSTSWWSKIPFTILMILTCIYLSYMGKLFIFWTSLSERSFSRRAQVL